MSAEPIDTVTLPDRQVWTLEDLVSLPDDGHRYEIVDGSLLMSPAPSKRHQGAAYRLANALRDAAPPGIEVAESVAVELGAETAGALGVQVPVPDIVVTTDEAYWDGRHGLLAGDLLLAVEVASPGSTRDRIWKPALYAGARVPAYWRVELDGPRTPAVVVYVLDAGTYREVRTVRAGESVVLDVPFAVELSPADLAGPRRRG